MRNLVLSFTAAVIIIFSFTSAALAHSCSSGFDCLQTAGYNAVVALAGGIIAVVTAVFGNQLAQSIASLFRSDGMKVRQTSTQAPTTARGERTSPEAQAEPEASTPSGRTTATTSEGVVPGRSTMDLLDWVAQQGGALFKQLSADMRKAILEAADAMINHGLEEQQRIVIKSLEDLLDYGRKAASGAPKRVRIALAGVQKEFAKLEKARMAYFTLSYVKQEDEVVAQVAKEAEISRKTAKALLEMSEEHFERMRRIFNEMVSGPVV